MAKEPRIVQLKITEFSKEGHGRGLWYSQDGKPYFVDVLFTIPGDEIEAEIFNRKKGIYQSRLLRYIKFSDQRITSRCKHFGYCGGCRWQQMSYEDQLKQKEARILRYFEPYLNDNVVWHPIIPCYPPWQYRNKMELTFSNDKEGHYYLGLIKAGTRGHVFQMEECFLFNPWMIEAVQAVTEWWKESKLEAYRGAEDRGSLRTLTFREGQRTGDRMVMLTVSGNPSYAISQKFLHQFVEILRNVIEPIENDKKLSIFLRIQQITKGSPTQYYEMLLYGPDHIREVLYLEISEDEKKVMEFRISPTAFFQPNTRQAEKLYSRTLQLTEISKGAVVFDLYCGTGTLGICMASKAKEVIGIELSHESALDARENVKFNHLSNMTVRTGDVATLLPLLMQEAKYPDIVFVDPPRIGLDKKTMQYLLSLKAPQLTYKVAFHNIELDCP